MNITKSLLQLVKEKINYTTKTNMKKGFKKIQKTISKQTITQIEKNIDKTYISQHMYINHSLIKYSKDKELLQQLVNMNSKDISKFLKKRDIKIINFDSFSDNSDTRRFTFLPYGGGKQNHKTIQQNIVANQLLNNPNIDSYYEMFLGGFGSVYNSLPILIENDIKDIYLSDINKSLINTYRQVQKNPKQVQRHLSSIDLDYFYLFGKFHPETKEEGNEWFDYIHSEFSKLETLNKMNPKRAAYFMYLLSNTQGGMLKYNDKSKTNKMSYIFDINKLKKVPLLINKVEIYHQIFNIINMKFSIKKYQTVHNKIKDNTNTLVLHDSPYAEFTNTHRKTMKNCSYNYGVNDFKQEPLLSKIKNSKYSVIYYNNHNPVIEEFSKKNTLTYLKMEVIYTNGKKNKKSIEIIMCRDTTNVSVKPINRTDYITNNYQKIS